MPAFLLFLGLALGALAGCDPAGPDVWELQGETMGTTFSVTLVPPADRNPGEGLAASITTLLDDTEQAMSTYLVHSEISRFNASSSTDWFPVSPPVCTAVEDALEISALTDGAFDITVGPLVNLWGFGPDGMRRRPPDAVTAAAARKRVGYRQLAADCAQPALKKSREDVYIDLSGYAKGFVVDRITALLDAEGMNDYMVEVGGELRMRGLNGQGTTWRVAIELPADEVRRVDRILELTDAAMATSGDYRNFFEVGDRRYSHAIDPRNGAPVTHNLAAVTVVSDRAAFADAMATALLVLGPRDGMQLAERRDMPVYFQLHQGERFTHSSSTAFRQLEGDR